MNDAKPNLQPLGFLVGRVYYNYVALLTQHLRETGLDEHLIPGMGGVLFVLYEEDNLSFKEVTRRAGIAASTLTGMVRRMEQAGLLEREADDEDRRSFRLRLTRRAEGLRGRCYAVSEALEAELNAGIPVGQQELLRRLMTQVSGNIQKRLRAMKSRHKEAV